MKFAGTLTLICLAFVALYFTSCADNKEEISPHSDHDHSQHSTPHKVKSELSGIKLNSGHKWKMDDHTRSMFTKMAASFFAAKPASLNEADLKKIGAQLQVQINELIYGCSMAGAAHDQLHLYLDGYIPAVTELAETGKKEAAASVAHYLKSYSDYFE